MWDRCKKYFEDDEVFFLLKNLFCHYNVEKKFHSLKNTNKQYRFQNKLLRSLFHIQEKN